MLNPNQTNIRSGGGALSADSPAAVRLPSLVLNESSLSMLKWLALLLMLVDHTNKYLFLEGQPWMYALGRISMPLFAFILGYNLSRPGTLESGAYRRTTLRLLAFGLLATPAFISVNHLMGGWYPLNILFALLVSVLAAWLFDVGGRWPIIGASLVVAWGGGMVEFWWPAVGIFLAVWSYRRSPSVGALLGGGLCLLSLYLINGNFWALAALPVIAASRFWVLDLPRIRWFFYAFYPAHLTAIWLYLAVVAH